MKWLEGAEFAKSHNFMKLGVLTDADIVNIVCWHRNTLYPGEDLSKVDREICEFLVIAQGRGVKFAICNHAVMTNEDETVKCERCLNFDELLERCG